MKKIFVILFLFICSCASAPKYLSFDEALETGIQKIGTDLPEGAQVAILDFKSDNENLSSYIIEEMYDKLVNFGKLVIMERSRTNTIAMEVGYQLSGEVDDNQIINIGHQLGADYVVTGQIIFSGEAYRLRVFAIDIEKGRRVASSSLNINSSDRQINYLLSTETIDNNVNTQNITEEAGEGISLKEAIIQSANFIDSYVKSHQSRFVIMTFAAPNNNFSNYIIDGISAELERRWHIVIGRQTLENVCRELNLTPSWNLHGESMFLIGRRYQADYLVFCQFYAVMGVYTYRWKLIDLKTLNVIQGIDTVLDDGTINILK